MGAPGLQGNGELGALARIGVDWGGGAPPPYPQEAAATPYQGRVDLFWVLMKQIFSLLAVLGFWVGGLEVVRAQASVVTNLVTYGNYNGTNFTSVIQLPGVYVPSPTFLSQFGAITNGGFSGSYTTNGITNCITHIWQISIDGSNSNWVSLATFNPTGTNGEFDTWTPAPSGITLYQRVIAVTTNSLASGVTRIK